MEKEKALMIVAFILLILNIYQYTNYLKLNEIYLNYKDKAEADIEKLTLEKNSLESELQNSLYQNQKLLEKNKNLEALYSQLNETYTKTVENYTLLNREYQSLKDEAKTLLTKLDEYEEKINESMSWFSLNSNIENMNGTIKTEIIDDLRKECYKIDMYDCKIKTACLYLVNDEFHHLQYLKDEDLYNRTDKLSSLDEFIAKDGGDCEDYSLFFKAEINHILNRCKGLNIMIESYTPSENGGRYFINNMNDWFIRDMGAKELKPNNIYPYIVCYLTEPYLGHCVVAFSKYEINDSSQIYLLEGADLVEPQDGSYVGEIGNEIKLPILTNGINELMIVISNDDLYNFEDGKWTGYKDFLFQIRKMRTELQDYLK